MLDLLERPGSCGPQLETRHQQGDEVDDAPEPVARLRRRLDLAVDGFCSGVADAELGCGDDVGLAAADLLLLSCRGLDLAVRRFAQPGIDQPACLGGRLRPGRRLKALLELPARNRREPASLLTAPGFPRWRPRGRWFFEQGAPRSLLGRSGAVNQDDAYDQLHHHDYAWDQDGDGFMKDSLDDEQDCRIEENESEQEYKRST